jgi:diguanylate cyclase (GGDEF)-like protein
LVNDTFGHHVGDQLLCGVADRLRQLAPSSAVVSRLSGDEFAVMVLDGHDPVTLARDVAEAVRQPLTLGPHTVAVTAGISIAATPTAEGALVSGVELRQQLDLALQAAKESGKGMIRAFEPSLRERFETEMTLRAELEEALRHGTLHIVYQPIVRLPSERLAGVEALARWHHRTLGEIPPVDFIAVAERAGLIHALGLFVLDRACQEFAAWDVERAMYLSVNVSTLQLLDPGFPDRAAAVLRAHDVDASRVVLEVTESVLVEESQLSAALHALRSRGVRIAVDDFGTGYASLRYLRSLPIDVVKIDRSYVTGLLHDPTATHVISSLTQLFHGLGLVVVAEGVEQQGQSHDLGGLGVDLGQGYLYGKPVPARLLPAPVPVPTAAAQVS